MDNIISETNYKERDNLGEKIREFRRSLNLTVEEFIDRINEHLGENVYAKEQIYKIETSYSKASANLMLDISQTFDVSLDSLYTGKEVYSKEKVDYGPELGVDIEQYTSFLYYIKHVLQSKGTPDHLANELLAKYEHAVADMAKLIEHASFIKGKLELAYEMLNIPKKPKQ